MNDVSYPINWVVKVSRITRSSNVKTLLEKKHSRFEDSTFMNDASRVWNLAPQAIRECISLFSAKKEIKKFIKTLPL